MKILHSNSRGQAIPEAALRRLPLYYRILQVTMTTGVTNVSCADLARVLGLDPTLVRKDIEMTGIVGKPRVGYPLSGPDCAGSRTSSAGTGPKTPFWWGPAV